MKKFKNPAPYSAEIENVKGEMFVISSEPITPEIIRQIDAINGGKLSGSERVTSLLCLVFNQPAEFWEDFTFQMLNSLIQDFTEEMAALPEDRKRDLCSPFCQLHGAARIRGPYSRGFRGQITHHQVSRADFPREPL